MTRILRATSQAEFLALVPTIAGYTASDSVLCVMFNGNRSVGAARVDLPKRERDADYRQVADMVTSIATRKAGADVVALVIYTDRSFESEHGIPWQAFATLLARRVERAGLHINGSFCVAADAWGDYFESHAPRLGHALEEIAQNPVAAMVRAAQGGPVPDIAAFGCLPEADPMTTARLSELLDGSLDLQDPHDFVERCLDGEPELADLARFVRLIQSPASRDAMMLQIGFGRIVGEAIAADNHRLLAAQRRTGLSMSEVVAAELAAEPGLAEDELLGLIEGKGTIRPDPDRISHAIRCLARATANIPEELRTAPLCMLSWLSWALGIGSAAGAYIEEALRLDPDYGMAQVLFALMSVRDVPEWVFVAE